MTTKTMDMTSEDEEKAFNRKLEQLKRDWNAVKPEHESAEELQRIKEVSRLSRVMTRPTKDHVVFAGKMLIAITAIMVFDYFTASKPFTMAWIILLLTDDYIGYRYMYFLPARDSIRETLDTSLRTLKRLRIIFVLTPIVIWMILRMILPLLPNGDRVAGTALALLPVLLLICLWVWIKWSVRIREVVEKLRTYNELAETNS